MLDTVNIILDRNGIKFVFCSKFPYEKVSCCSRNLGLGDLNKYFKHTIRFVFLWYLN